MYTVRSNETVGNTLSVCTSGSVARASGVGENRPPSCAGDGFEGATGGSEAHAADEITNIMMPQSIGNIERRFVMVNRISMVS